MMDTQQDDQISNTTGAAEQPASVGKVLREARELLGLSVNDVANRIKFAARQIEALEADDYAQLPEAAFVRGFVRSYARLLELDPAQLVSGLPSSHTKTSAVQEVKSVDIPLPSAFSTRRYNIILLSAGLAIALSVAIFMRMHDRVPEATETVAKTPAAAGNTPATASNTTVQPLELPNVAADVTAQGQLPVSAPQPAVSAAPVPAPQQAVRAAPAQAAPQATPKTVPAQAVRATPLVPVVQQPAPTQAVRTAPAAAPVQQPVIAKAAPAASATVAGSARVSEQPKVNGSEHALRLEFDENAWVEVRDAHDNVLVAKMHRAGSLLRVTGKAPLLVTIGNAHAVRLFDNGKNIKLEHYITADVAHVKLK